ncbi:hypothetical protein PHLCEN_2v6251 [Hermanssonia centrifuga]|uniref:Uncharacterized protein n=1 Tax=Hermanssonia centrifuga TaxID=98765 RepID=A0A2R6P000_9APHY|nr:hypothetical protein PHLCEN_2v6251 [Hermanssonia centrifuga]
MQKQPPQSPKSKQPRMAHRITAELKKHSTTNSLRDCALGNSTLALPLVDKAVGVGTALLLLVGTSPSADAAPPKRVLAMAQMLRIPLTTEGRSGVFSTSV